MPDTVSAPDRDFRDEARRLLRQWLVADEGDVLSAIDSLGRGAVSAAADASARLDRGVSSTRSAEASLRNLQALAASLDAPPPRRRGLFGRAPEQADGNVQARIEALVESLDGERDAVARSLITIETDTRKLRDAADALDRALGLVRACAGAVEAAARELTAERPERARFLRETVGARLLSREQDLATQAAVTHQGVLTLQLLRDSQDALGQALARARDTSVAALRTAIAARSAVSGSQDLARQTDALARTVRAAEDAPETRRDLQRVLDDAVEQARRAISAAQANPRGGSTPL